MLWAEAYPLSHLVMCHLNQTGTLSVVLPTVGWKLEAHAPQRAVSFYLALGDLKSSKFSVVLGYVPLSKVTHVRPPCPLEIQIKYGSISTCTASLQFPCLIFFSFSLTPH